MTAPKRALIVVDVQNEYVSGNLRIEYPPVDQSLARIAQAMDAAHAAGIPIVVVQHLTPASAPIFAQGSHGAALHPVVAQRPYDCLIEKKMASAFAGTALADWLHAQAIDTLTLVGYMTHNCDDATARHAAHHGWKVEFLHDAAGSVPYANAHGSASAEDIHRIFTLVLHTGFAAVASTAQWLEALATGSPLTVDNVYASNQRVIGARGAGAMVGESCESAD